MWNLFNETTVDSDSLVFKEEWWLLNCIITLSI